MDNLSPQQRKAAWMQRRNERLAKNKKEADDRANAIMNSTKHFLPSQLKALKLKDLVEMALDFCGNPNVYGCNGREFRDADKVLIKKEVCRRARRRKVEGADNFRIAYNALRDEVAEYEKKAEMAQHVNNIKLLKNTLGSVETGMTQLAEDAPKVGGSLDENVFFDEANDLYIMLFSDVPSYFRVKIWTKDLVKKFHDGLLKMKEMIESMIQDRESVGEPFGPPEHKSSDPGDNKHIRDLASIKVRKIMFGI